MTSTAPEKALISSFLLAKRRVLWGVLRQHPSLSSPSSSWRKLAISSPDPPPPVPWHTARPCSPATFKVRRGHVIESSSMGTEVTETSPHMGHNPHPPPAPPGAIHTISLPTGDLGCLPFTGARQQQSRRGSAFRSPHERDPPQSRMPIVDFM